MVLAVVLGCESEGVDDCWIIAGVVGFELWGADELASEEIAEVVYWDS